MIYIKRTATPSCLLGGRAKEEADWAKDHFEGLISTKGEFTEFTQYGVYEVRVALLNMSNQKCAYCEMQIGKGTLEVEHYRPKGNADKKDPSGYWWLALEWTNLLPSCPACNRRLRQHIVTADMTVLEVEEMQLGEPEESFGKFIQFPITNARLIAPSHDHISEGALLIDPTRNDPELELKWRSDSEYSVVEPADRQSGLSALGETTIGCVALNRVDLVIMRTAILNGLRVQKRQVMDKLQEKAGVGASQQDIAEAVNYADIVIDCMKRSANSDQPFAGMVRAFIAKFEAELLACMAV